MRSREELFQWVTEILKREFQFTDEQLHPKAHLIEDLDLDSIDAVDLVARLEEFTEITISEEELKSVQTIEDVVDLVDGRV